jgi:hypothetical protein
MLRTADGATQLQGLHPLDEGSEHHPCARPDTALEQYTGPGQSAPGSALPGGCFMDLERILDSKRLTRIRNMPLALELRRLSAKVCFVKRRRGHR